MDYIFTLTSQWSGAYYFGVSHDRPTLLASSPSILVLGYAFASL